MLKYIEQLFQFCFTVETFITLGNANCYNGSTRKSQLLNQINVNFTHIKIWIGYSWLVRIQSPFILDLFPPFLQGSPHKKFQSMDSLLNFVYIRSSHLVPVICQGVRKCSLWFHKYFLLITAHDERETWICSFPWELCASYILNK
jgi:hypothetical protein